MGPVFLFYVSIILFMIGPAPGEVDWVFSMGKMPEEMVVQEFATVITVEAE